MEDIQLDTMQTPERVKVNIPLDAVPNYTIQQVFSTLQSLGYAVTNVEFNESQPANPEDVLIYAIDFMITGLPITHRVGDSVHIVTGVARVTIYGNETIHQNHIYIQDITMSTFKAVSDEFVISDSFFYKSFAIDTLFHTLLKTLLIVKTNEEVENQ